MGSTCRTILVAAALLGGAALVRATFAQDPADEAFDPPAVKELAARAEALPIDDRLALLQRIRRSFDRDLLVPPEAAWKGFESLRGRTDAGLARILERGLFSGIVSPREGGAYWSFTKRSNSYNDEPQIELQNGSFSTGFAGADTGFVVRLENVPLLSADESSVPDVLRGAPDDVNAAARGTRRAPSSGGAGGAGGDSRPVRDAKAEAGAVYAVRAVMWDRRDVLAAFQVVTLDARGATIAWRLLRTYDVPNLKR